MKENMALIKNIYIDIQAPDGKEAKLLDSSQKKTVGNFMCGIMPSSKDEIGFAIITNGGVSIAFSLKKETVLSLVQVLTNAALDGETKQ